MISLQVYLHKLVVKREIRLSKKFSLEEELWMRSLLEFAEPIERRKMVD